MPNWNESEFVERAKDLARQHVSLQKSINDLAEKVARDESLNPDEIRTLVRITNVQVFGEKFASMDGSDKNVVFDVGDPEIVIHRIVDGVVNPPQSANIYNDKLAHEVPNFMRDIRRGVSFDDSVKIAHEDLLPKPVRNDTKILYMRKLAEDMHLEQLAFGHQWEEKLAALTQLLRKAPGYGLSFEDFEKNAFAEYGEAIRPELTQLHKDLRRKVDLLSEDKVAQLASHHLVDDSRELRLLKQALDARINYVKLRKASSWLRDNTPEV